MQFMNFRAKNRGFSLVELSISLAIISMIAGSAISVAISSDSQIKKVETEAKLNRIEEAIAGFLQSNLRLPCPADGTLTTSNANFGLEGTPTTTDCPNKNFTNATVRGGVVPVRSLMLPDEFMFDGWGRRISYITSLSMVNNYTTNPAVNPAVICPSSNCFADGDGVLIINDGYGGNRMSIGVYVLMSHGENGHGAYPKNGGATRINGFPAGIPYRNDSADELANAKFDNTGAATAYNGTFVMKDYVREDDVTDAHREYFDDIIRFKNKSQVVMEAGALIYNSICTSAKNIIDGISSTSCGGAYSESKCESFASEIYARCLQ
jgi:prepilin-type N-terminal cleavage/methylation domain-containing protein